MTKGEGGKNFDHPYFVTFLLSIAQILVYFVYLAKERLTSTSTDRSTISHVEIYKHHDFDGVNQTLDSSLREESEKPKAPEINKKLLAIPAVLDGIENVLKNISLTMISSSIVQMLRSTVMLYCALLAMMFLKKRLYRHHWTAMSTIGVGVIMIGIAYLQNEDK